MELCLIIPIIGLSIIALSIMFFFLALTSNTCFKKLSRADLYYLYCVSLFIIGISMLLISVSPENEENIIERLKNGIYNLNTTYSPCNREDNKDNRTDININDNDNIIDFNVNNNSNGNDDISVDNNEEKNNDNERNEENNENERNENEINEEKYNDNDFNNNNNDNNDDYNDNDENRKDLNIQNGYIIRNVTFNPAKFIVYNFCKFWIKLSNFLRLVGEKTFGSIFHKKQEKIN